MEKETFIFKRISLRKDSICVIRCKKMYDSYGLIIDYKRNNNDLYEFDFEFKNKESALQAHTKLIALLNKSKDDDFIDIGNICDEVKNNINNKIEADEKEVYYKINN